MVTVGGVLRVYVAPTGHLRRAPVQWATIADRVRGPSVDRPGLSHLGVPVALLCILVAFVRAPVSILGLPVANLCGPVPELRRLVSPRGVGLRCSCRWNFQRDLLAYLFA